MSIITVTERETALADEVRRLNGELELQRMKTYCAQISDIAMERDALKADAARTKLTKIERECLLIGKEIQRAAGELPDGYEIEIQIERGYGGVTLERPDYTRLVFDDAVDGLSHCITQAVDAAMKGKS